MVGSRDSVAAGNAGNTAALGLYFTRRERSRAACGTSVSHAARYARDWCELRSSHLSCDSEVRAFGLQASIGRQRLGTVRHKRLCT